jgi:small ligand-binding sensory domain FIST
MTTLAHTKYGFAVAHAAVPADEAAEWGKLAMDCVGRLGPVLADATLGFIYITDPLADELPRIVAFLRQTTGIRDWVGSVGIGIAAGDREYFGVAALAVMVASLPPNSYRMLPLVGTSTEALTELTAWAEQAGPTVGLVHGDPGNANLPAIINHVAARSTGFLVGGLSSSRGLTSQVAGQVVRGGLSGVMLSAAIGVATGLSQGCTPIGPLRRISAARDNIVLEIDDRPALDVFKEDIGDILARRLERVAGYIHVALPVAASDTGDYLVRNLIGIDVERGWLAVGERVATGDSLIFVRRDRDAAEQDLVRMLGALKRRIAMPPRGGIYFSCIARGPSLFGPHSEELAILRRELGDFPLVGMFCNGEISNNRLYGYTGVLALFL